MITPVERTQHMLLGRQPSHGADWAHHMDEFIAGENIRRFEEQLASAPDDGRNA